MVNTTGCEKQRISALLGVNAVNDTLPLYVVLKGKKVPRDVEHLQSRQIVISSNKNAWLTEATFLEWIEKVWGPYSVRFERLLLIMDSFKVHKLKPVLDKLEHYKTDVIFIPCGLTFYCQPCDVFLNKPIKDMLRKSWQEFISRQAVDTEGKILRLKLNFIRKTSKTIQRKCHNLAL